MARRLTNAPCICPRSFLLWCQHAISKERMIFMFNRASEPGVIARYKIDNRANSEQCHTKRYDINAHSVIALASLVLLHPWRCRKLERPDTAPPSAQPDDRINATPVVQISRPTDQVDHTHFTLQLQSRACRQPPGLVQYRQDICQ